jgi:hypothetical protein
VRAETTGKSQSSIPTTSQPTCASSGHASTVENAKIHFQGGQLAAPSDRSLSYRGLLALTSYLYKFSLSCFGCFRHCFIDLLS